MEFDMINSFRGKYNFLSNFYPVTIYPTDTEDLYPDFTYPSVEHAFQAAKTDSINEKKWIANAASPVIAKRLGRQVTLRKDWHEIKLGEMICLVYEKFKDNNKLQKLLLDTGDEELVEGNNWNDCYWGVCRGRGENHLGKILMNIRRKLNND